MLNYEDGYKDGYADGWDSASEHYGHTQDYFQEIADLENQRDALWNFLQDKDIHVPDGNCWCSDIKHVIV